MPIVPNICPICGRFRSKEAAQGSSQMCCLPDAATLDSPVSSPVPLADLKSAAKVINQADSLLVLGLENLDMDSQMAAWRLADRSLATIDSSINPRGRGKMLAMQRHGKVTASFGEIRNRSDLMLFWFCDPATQHPCLFELLTERDHHRKMISIGPKSKTSDSCDQVISMQRDALLSLVTLLRGLHGGVSFDDNAFAVVEAVGVTSAQVRALYESVVTAKSVAMFLPSQDATSEDGMRLTSSLDVETEALMQLVTELNSTNVVVVQDFNGGGKSGAEYVMSAASGFPFAMDLNRGFARFHGNDKSANSVLANGECDAAIFFTTSLIAQEVKGLESLSPEAMSHLTTIPVIEIGSGRLPGAEVSIDATATNVKGVARFLRADGTMLEVTREPTANSAEGILNELVSFIQ